MYWRPNRNNRNMKKINYRIQENKQITYKVQILENILMMQAKKNISQIISKILKEKKGDWDYVEDDSDDDRMRGEGDDDRDDVKK